MAVFIIGDKIYHPEQLTDWCSGPVKDRPCSNRALVAALAALVERASRDIRVLFASAFWTHKSFWPATVKQVLSTLFVGCKSLLKSEKIDLLIH